MALRAKSAVGFEHPAQGPHHCSQCRHYNPPGRSPHSCGLVQGKVQKSDWCKLFQAKPGSRNDRLRQAA